MAGRVAELQLAHAIVLEEVSRELRPPACRRIAERLRAWRPADPGQTRMAELLEARANDFDGYADYIEDNRKQK